MDCREGEPEPYAIFPEHLEVKMEVTIIHFPPPFPSNVKQSQTSYFTGKCFNLCSKDKDALEKQNKTTVPLSQLKKN